MAWWDIWRGKSFTARDKDSPVYDGGGTWSDEVMTAHRALMSSAYFACVRLYCQIIATVPLGVYQKLENGERKSRPDHPLYRLLNESPNADQTAVEFWEGRVLGLCTSGHGYAEKVMIGDRLVSLEPMPPETYARRLESGKREYRFVRYGKEVILPEERVFHITAFGGMSPVSHARQTLNLTLATERAASQTFSKGMRAKGFFVMPNGSAPLQPAQREQAQKNLVEPFSGPNGKDWGILEGGVDVKTITISPKDAELILSRRFNVEDVCRWLGVPPIMIGHAGEGTTMWGTGVEQVMLGFYKTGLIPYLERIEQRIKKDLMTPADRAAGLYAEFNVEGLLRGDSAARGQLYSTLIQNGVMKPNEARSKENMPHEDGGDQLLINSTLIPLSQAGQSDDISAARNSLRAFLGVTEPPPKETQQ